MMKGLGDIYAARQDAADEDAERCERIRDEAYDEAYDCARAGLAAGAPATLGLLGELVLEDEDDLDHLLAAMRHAARGDMHRAGAMVAVLVGSVLQRHATLAADLAVMRAQAGALVAEAEAPEGHIEMGWPA